MKIAANRLASVLALTLMAAGCAHQPSVPSAALAEQELRALHEQWGEARIKGDTTFLERFYGAELQLNVMTGDVNTRAQDIALFDWAGKTAAEIIKPEYIHDDDLRVLVYGDAAVVTGVENLRGTAMGRYGELALRFTNVLIHRDGRWQLVQHQSTPVQKR